ncbi:ankyrin repeat domain-containing protein [Aspergillus aculeatinus CBS 121060]|uniref:Ankyrin repeat protein n=1 Tax=Aspergillus aculeatinus CBS 121060 TaxID=1448322 RepID=A0ACD1GTW3_9EURO|nr:ankyrin repeat protein [Aspergillus aculeatinus CBS 121060]RAH64635.1 ankyrin repeat protein [Aspergillus aculeatinus CBS 121060]
MAAKDGHVGVARLLLAAGASPDVKDTFGQTPLVKAAQAGWKEVVQLLLATDGVDRNSQDAEGRTPLSWAAENGFVDVVKVLLAADGDPTLPDNDGKTPLSWAEDFGNEILADLLRGREK